MSKPVWRFREKHRDEVHLGLQNTEFFAQQDVAERLVREAGQNTIDAAYDGETARLVFSLTRAPAEAWNRYFGSLWPHLEAQRELRELLPASDEPIPCLLVEDHGTTGLTGPLEPRDRKAAEQDEKGHRLFWFFKNVGRTSKTGEQLGSFGIGKTVFPYSSKINSFFGLSVRRPAAGEPSIVLLGQSQLREHRISGTEADLDQFGFFAWQTGVDGSVEQRAIDEPPILDDFRRTFGIRRANEERGLSVVIPYPEDGLTRTDLARAAILQFFLPILDGQLIIEINDAGESVILSSATLLESIDRFTWNGSEGETLKRRVKLAIWALDEGRKSIVHIAAPASETKPMFEDRMLDESDRTDLSQRFIAGQRISMRVPVPVERKGAEPEWSKVDVFFEYDRRGLAKEDMYARKGLTLIDHTGHANQAGLTAILVAEDKAIYELLRASENVAHTKWRRRGADRLTQQFIRGAAKVEFVLGIVPQLIQALLSPEEQADWWTLADLFPTLETSPLPERPTPDGEVNTGKKPEDESPTEEEDPDEQVGPFPKKLRQWRAKATESGFRIEGNPDFEGDLRAMQIVAAYGLLHKRAYRVHDPIDFSFSTDTDMIATQGAVFEAIDHNILRIVPSEREFWIEIKGFDPRRALDYRVVVEEQE